MILQYIFIYNSTVSVQSTNSRINGQMTLKLSDIDKSPKVCFKQYDLGGLAHHFIFRFFIHIN